MFEQDPGFYLPVEIFVATPKILFLISASFKVVTSLLRFKEMVLAKCLQQLLQSFLSDLRGSKDALFCLLPFPCLGPVSSEAIILHGFSLPRTAEGESKYLYKMDQTLPPLTCKSKHPEDSGIPAWR